MGAQVSPCNPADSYCNGDERMYQVRCAVQRVALHRKQPVGTLDRLFGPNEPQVYVEVSVACNSDGASNKPSSEAAQVYHTEAGQLQDKAWGLWTWDGVEGETPESGRKQENGHGGVVNLQAAGYSMLSLQVVALEANTAWLSGSKDMHARVLGEAQLSVKEDFIANFGASGEFTWPLVLENRVCGSIGLFVTVRSEDVLRLDCSRGIDDQVLTQDEQEAGHDAMYGHTQRSTSKSAGAWREKQNGNRVSMQVLGKEMFVSHVCVQKGNLGVKVGPVQISSALVCLKVVQVNDEARAAGLGIGKGDLLYGIDGGIFCSAEDFMMRLKTPPYLLTVLRE